MRAREGREVAWPADQVERWPIDRLISYAKKRIMRGQAVYEPFSGSGTTIIAAEMTGRVCHAIEIAPAYVDVAVKRWQEFTGEQAVLDGDGRSFDSVAAQRAR